LERVSEFTVQSSKPFAACAAQGVVVGGAAKRSVGVVFQGVEIGEV
jgi:hypothetical protein